MWSSRTVFEKCSTPRSSCRSWLPRMRIRPTSTGMSRHCFGLSATSTSIPSASSITTCGSCPRTSTGASTFAVSVPASGSWRSPIPGTSSNRHSAGWRRSAFLPAQRTFSAVTKKRSSPEPAVAGAVKTPRHICRAETVGSLLRPPDLLAARQAAAHGRITREELRQAEDRAVMEAVRVQEAAGLDVVTDGEMRRGSWAVTTEALEGFELRPGGPGLVWRGQGKGEAPPAVSDGYPTVVRPISERRRLAGEYAFLAACAPPRTQDPPPAPRYPPRFL